MRKIGTPAPTVNAPKGKTIKLPKLKAKGKIRGRAQRKGK
jgi:hypothetical protein